MCLKPGLRILCLVSFQFLASNPAVFAQDGATVVSGTDPYHKVVIAGKEYEASRGKERSWGKHYRKEWTTPVRVPILRIDSAYGGLTPVEQGGGRQTKTLRLKAADGKEYVLRSISKTFGKAMDESVRGTFIEKAINDQVSSGHPYAAITIPPLAEAAKIYHTNPTIVYVPHGSNLGQFDKTFGDDLYLFEERPDDDQRDNPSFGNSPHVIGTEQLLDTILKENNHKIDQEMYVRSRLFDMFLGDWGRHEDQWRWASFSDGNETRYRPIPRDRDQAYTLFDGFIVSSVGSMLQPGLQSFDYKIKDIRTYNYPARFLDRRLANEATLDTWISEARMLKSNLTDEVINQAIAKLPPEVYPISGKIIAEKLKSRRDKLEEYAKDYYTFLSKVVDIVGSEKNEWFEVTEPQEGRLAITVSAMNADQSKGRALYHRVFNGSETNEIRVYGIAGNDKFVTNGSSNSGIKVRLIGGPQTDQYEAATENKGIPVKVYDNKRNPVQLKRANLHLKNDLNINDYNYNEFSYNKHGFKKAILYNNLDRVFIRTGYYIQKAGWRKRPYAYRQDLNLNYSLIQNAFSVEYTGLFVEAVGKWNLVLTGAYDGKRDFHYPGVGNEVKIDVSERGFYRINTREFHGNIGLDRSFPNQRFGIYGFYQGIKTLHDDNDKFISPLPEDNELFEHRDYVGVRSEYQFLKLNHMAVPTKGIGFLSEIGYTKPLDDNAKPFFRLSGTFGFYIPILKNLAIASKTNAATLTNNSNDLYQLNKLGGASNFRGYLRYRFYGQSSFLNSNELQWTFNFKSRIMNGTAGLIGFFDNGRVWVPGEVSDTWHTSYGGGVMLAPFRKIVAAATYGFTKEGNRLNIRLGRLF